MINLETIRALPDAELHELIALRCYGWRPIEYADVRAATGCTHRAPDGGFHTVPEYSASWDLTMPLANQARITSRWVIMSGWAYDCYARDRHEGRTIRLASDADDHAHCRALCELALWRAMQDQDAEENLDVP